MNRPQLHETWRTPTSFLLMIIGAAVGLGTFWRFPYLVGEYGGGAFILVYIVCVLLVSLPMAMAETAIGRRGGESAVRSLPRMALEEGGSRKWKYFPWLTIFTNLVGLGFYAVIASWAIAYVYKTATGQFAGTAIPDSRAVYAAFQADVPAVLFWHAAYMFCVVTVVALGIRKGIERALRFMMPTMAIILLMLVAYALTFGDVGTAMRFLFAPDFSKIDTRVVLIALGHAIFTIGVGGIGMATFAAYLPGRVSVAGYVLKMGATSVCAALLAGIAIFPIVFAHHLPPGSGPGLVFETMPIVFNQMPAGRTIGTAFFLLLSFAALVPSVAALEPCISWAEEKRGWRRAPATITVGLVTWLLGVASALSFNVLANFQPLGAIAVFEGRTVFGISEYLVSNFTLPAGVFLWTVFAGWLMTDRVMVDALGIGSGVSYRLWRVLVRYVAPIAIIALFIFNFVG
jgi:NSS family neurotransmitter:Na+ symporter